MENEEIKLLEDYSSWLNKKGYIDSDFYTEEPKAIDQFLKEKQLKCKGEETEKSWKVKIRMVDTDFKDEDDEDSVERIIIGIPKTDENEEMIRQIFGKEIEIRLS